MQFYTPRLYFIAVIQYTIATTHDANSFSQRQNNQYTTYGVLYNTYKHICLCRSAFVEQILVPDLCQYTLLLHSLMVRYIHHYIN